MVLCHEIEYIKSINGECKRRIRRYLLHAWTYRIFKQQNGIVPWNTGTLKPTISDDRRMQKGEYDIFCMLGRIVFSSHCRMDAFLYNTASIGTSSINSKERVVTHLDILLVDDRP
jgi:hypothetical protein